MSYDILASFYDRFNSEIDYENWAKNIALFLKDKGIDTGSRLLDIACGTGKMTVPLAEMGYVMTGVDLSEEMLSKAEHSASEKGLFPTFVCQDMTTLDLGGLYDSAICCLDSLNYIPQASLDSFFARAGEHIKTGGYLFFDINTEYKFENIYADNSYVYDEKDVFCVWQNFYVARRRLCDFELTFFIKNADGSYRRVSESQREYFHSDAELKNAFESNGFECVFVTSKPEFLGQASVSLGDERRYFVLRKTVN